MTETERLQLEAGLNAARRKLEDARWRIGEETRAWGRPAREAVRRRDGLVREVWTLERDLWRAEAAAALA